MGKSKVICPICNKEFERATAKKKYCGAVHGANSKEEAVEKWNNRVEHLKERDQQIGYEKIFEEMQMNSLR